MLYNHWQKKEEKNLIERLLMKKKLLKVLKWNARKSCYYY